MSSPTCFRYSVETYKQPSMAIRSFYCFTVLLLFPAVLSHTDVLSLDSGVVVMTTSFVVFIYQQLCLVFCAVTQYSSLLMADDTTRSSLMMRGAVSGGRLGHSLRGQRGRLLLHRRLRYGCPNLRHAMRSWKWCQGWR